MRLPDVAVMLNTQYRMHEHIMNFSNQKFYGSELKADVSVKGTLLSNDPEKHLLHQPFDFIDTAGCGFNEILNQESLSIANPEEAQLLIKHLKLLLDQYKVSEHQKESLSIGIISPYKEQVQHLANLFSEDTELKENGAKISVKTIDGFQGQERDIIYISLARSNDTGEIGFLSDTRRMNVALTRAKRKLVVIGDSATIGNHPFYKSFLDYAESIGAYRSAWEFVSI